MGIHDRPTALRSPWQNGDTERLIGSIRWEYLDHIVVFGERHLRHIILSYMPYYSDARTHLSLNKDAPVSRVIQAVLAHSAGANSRRITPPLRSDLISDRDRRRRPGGVHRRILSIALNDDFVDSRLVSDCRRFFDWRTDGRARAAPHRTFRAGLRNMILFIASGMTTRQLHEKVS